MFWLKVKQQKDGRLKAVVNINGKDLDLNKTDGFIPDDANVDLETSENERLINQFGSNSYDNDGGKFRPKRDKNWKHKRK